MSKENKKKPNCQDHRYLCYFLNKNGVYELINKSRKISKKKQLLKWIENKIYKDYKHTIDSSTVRIYKKDHEPPNKFKSNLYKKYQKKKDKYEKMKKDAIKEALKDAEINYYGLEDYLRKHKKCNQVFKKYYDRTWYENVDYDKEPKEFSIFTYY